jgi:hypothetical protein
LLKTATGLFANLIACRPSLLSGSCKPSMAAMLGLAWLGLRKLKLPNNSNERVGRLGFAFRKPRKIKTAYAVLIRARDSSGIKQDGVSRRPV